MPLNASNEKGQRMDVNFEFSAARKSCTKQTFFLIFMKQAFAKFLF